MNRSRPAAALLSLSLMAVWSCSDRANLFTPDTALQSSALAPQCFGLAATIYEGNPGAGTITSNGSGGLTMTGTSGNDVIVGSAGNDVIDAGDGTDRVCAGDGDDIISGGTGTNRIDGELGVDAVDYGAAAAGVRVNLTNGTARNASIIESISNVEHIRGSAFDDDLRGDSLSNLIFGAAGNDVLVGFGAADTLLGQDGHDAINGGDGADVLSGGAGNDGFLPGAGADQIVGQGGFDIVNYNGSAPIEVNLATNTGTNGDAAGDTWAGIESIVGTAGADLLIGDDNGNEFDGRGGDDVIHGGGGRDRLIGGAGADEIHGGDDIDHLSGQDGDDTLSGDGGDDVFVPGAGFNIIDGGIGNDRIYSGNCLDDVTSVEIIQTNACAGDVTQVAIASDSSSLVAGSGNTTTVTVQLQDGSGNNLTLGGRTVTLATTAGTLSVGAGEFASVTAIDNNDGTYSATLTASASLENATLTTTVDGSPVTGTHDVAFLGALDHFAVTFTDDGVIPAQGTGTAFNIKIVALDAAENPASYNGTVDLTYEGAVSGTIGVSGNFVAGVLNPQAVAIPEEGSVSIRATRTGGSETGASIAFTVSSPFIILTPDSTFVLSGGTVTLTAVVKNFDGTDAADQSVTWGTADSAIATVDGSGLVSGVAVGYTNITVTQGALSSTAQLGVCPDIPVGGVYTATFPAAASTCFGGGAGAQEYTYMPINLSTSIALSLTVTAFGIQAVTGPPTPNVVEQAANPLGLQHALADESLHMQMMRVNEQLPMIKVAAGARPGREMSVAIGRGSAASQVHPTWTSTPTVGDLWSVNVGTTCTGPMDARTGMVRTISQHAIIVSDTANPVGGYTTAQYDSIGLEFDSIAYPTDTINFGGPSDVDGNGKVVLFFTRAVNELSPPASSSVVNGYFLRRDLSAADPVLCPNSNEGEILYMLVPDPTGAVNSNVRTVSFVRGNVVRGTGHELQHLINAGRRMYVNSASSFEETWLDEQLSYIAEELMFYRTAPGLAPRGNTSLSTLTTGPFASRRVAAFNTYANGNFGRMRSWLQRPDTVGAFKNTTSFAAQGAGWSFLRYAADRVNGTDADFWSALVNSQLEGTANIQNAIGGADPQDWLRDFTAAMYADDAVGTAAAYTQPSWNFRSVYGGLGGFALLARPLTDNVALTLSYSRGGGSSYVRFGVPAAGFATTTALSGGTIPTSPYGLIVMRTK